MHRHLAGWVAAPLVFLSGAVSAQEPELPALLVAPWAGPPNMSTEVAAQVLSGIDALGYFDRFDWDDLVASSRVTRDMPDHRKAELTCIHGRQLATVESIRYVLCGTLVPTPEGVRIELELWDIESGGADAHRFHPLVASDQETLVTHALTQIQEWTPE